MTREATRDEGLVRKDRERGKDQKEGQDRTKNTTSLWALEAAETSSQPEEQNGGRVRANLGFCPGRRQKDGLQIQNAP